MRQEAEQKEKKKKKKVLHRIFPRIGRKLEFYRGSSFARAESLLTKRNVGILITTLIQKKALRRDYRDVHISYMTKFVFESLNVLNTNTYLY